jgi:hypothetical protein
MPIHEAKIASFGTLDKTGPIDLPSEDKLIYLKENFNFPLDIPPDIRAKYEELILRNHDIFAKDKYDLGFSDKDSHKINMKTQQPVYVKQFCIPGAYKEEILTHVTEWRKQSVIEEYSSPYIAPFSEFLRKEGAFALSKI